ncbi:MAG TPA: DNA-binding domain-containing protein [Bacteriovoracaceae bacterium]|nr:DNA-binding domain-containing protein [Bacteriovoracaceae bacterium]
MQLKELQEQFSQFLYSQSPDGASQEWIENCLSKSSIRETQSRLKVYRNNLMMTLVPILKEIYPVTQKILTPEAFVLLAKEFIYLRPSKVCDLNCYGAGFVEHLHGKTELATHPYLSDLMRLELAWNETSQLRPRDLLTLDRLLQEFHTHGPSFTFSLNRSAQILVTGHEVLKGWQTIRNSTGQSEPFFASGKQRLMIWHDAEGRKVHQLENELWPFISGVMAGHTIQQMSESLVFVQNPGRLQECINLSVLRGWLSYK